MSSKPRNVRYFPRMKVRGAERRVQVPLLNFLRTLDTLNKTLSDGLKKVKKIVHSPEETEVTIHE